MRRGCLRLVPPALATLALLACSGTPDNSGEAYVTPVYRASGFSERDLRKVKAFVSPQARDRIFQKVAVIPFRAPVEFAGAGIAAMFTAELMKTRKYQVVERGLTEQVLEERAVGLERSVDIPLAMEVGKALGVQGVIVGTVPEYVMRIVGTRDLPAISVDVSMIDVLDGTVVWSVAGSGLSSEPTSLSSFAETVVRLATARLQQEWLKTGDLLAVSYPAPKVTGYAGTLRGAELQVVSEPEFITYRLFRSPTMDGTYTQVFEGRNSGGSVILRDTDLRDLDTYYYQVSGVTSRGFRGMPAGPFEVTTAGPPGAVSGLVAQSGVLREVPLAWDPLVEPYIKGYRISRRREGGSWKQVRTLGNATTIRHVDRKLDDGATYEYRVTAFNDVGVEGPPATVSATTKGPPSPVPYLRALSDQPRRVPLSWEPVVEPEVRGYAIYRADREEGPFRKIRDVDGSLTTEHLDEGRSSGWRNRGGGLGDREGYFYRIRAVNEVGVQSADSPTASAVTKAVPVPVSGLSASYAEVRKVSLSWNPNPEVDIERYEIFRGSRERSVDEKVADVASETTSYVDGKLENGTEYFYRLRAIDRDGLTGEYSPVVSSRTKPVPGKPINLTGIQKGRDVAITWQENPERDISHYVISRGGFLSGKDVGTVQKPPFSYSPESEGTVRLQVRAVDEDGLESEPSEEFRLRVTFPKE